MSQPGHHGAQREVGVGDSALTNLSLSGGGCKTQTNLWHTPKTRLCSLIKQHAVGGLVTSTPHSDSRICLQKLRLSIAVILFNRPINARFM